MAARYPCLRLEGGLLATDLIDRIAEGLAPGQKISDFGLEGRRHLSDEIAASWTDARDFWRAFQHRLERLPEDDPATSVTRDQWMIPLLSLLGYELTYMARAAEVDGQTYSLSHRAGKDENTPPVHIVGYRQSLDRRPESGRPRLAPHSLLQEYINRTEHLWGLVANGNILRLLRNSQRMRRQAYIEFDIQQMMEGEKFADFALLYRLTHRTRLPRTVEDTPESLLEKYYRETVDQGGRVRDHLRDGVEKALRLFANGMLHHPRNRSLLEKTRNKELNPHSFYRQLLRLIYRLLFLMVGEERSLITDNVVYRDHYSISRLRSVLENRSAYSDYDDLWLNLKTTFQLFQDETLGKYLGVPPLNGDLFDLSQTSDLTNASLPNSDLLSGLWHLSMYRENERTPWRRINYAALDVEELGSIYESLLDFQPIFLEKEGGLVFELAFGMERKSTGSYYTPPELVQELIKSALEPVIKERLSKPGSKETALLSIRAVDPAAGSGHFLLAAARRLGRELAKIRTGDDEPSPESLRNAIRDVITHCIYGVDKNPLAVDLCKVALWMEGHSKGKPLTFLDHRIRCGDSLVGVFNLDVIKEGIPDEAFEPVTGDDKTIARQLKKRNREERTGQLRGLPLKTSDELRSLTESRRLLLELPDDTPEQIHQKAKVYQNLQGRGTKWWQDNTACNLWAGAFFNELTPENNRNNRINTTEDLQRYLENQTIDGRLIGIAWALAQKHCFFHWPLEFPEVFDQGGFDVVLGNPPWERIKLQEQEFFAAKDADIANAPNKAARQRLIKQLPETNPGLLREYQQALHGADALSKFLREGNRFPLTARGDINTYAIFAEVAQSLLAAKGRAGIIVPTGIATDDTTKVFFGNLVKTQRLVALFGMDNEAMIFSSIDHRNKFGLLCLGGVEANVTSPVFTFSCSKVEYISHPERQFTITYEDFTLLNPNTRTCPVFRTRTDAELTKIIYRRVPLLVDESRNGNPWGVKFMTMFHMANDSGLFQTSPGHGLLPLYEAKMIYQFDHRYATYEGATQANMNEGSLPKTSSSQKQDPFFIVRPRYWVNQSEVKGRLKDWKYNWLLAFRDITSSVVERTAIFSPLPRLAVGHTMPLVFFNKGVDTQYIVLFIANANSIIFDYIARQKIGGTHLTYTVLNQLPALSPSSYTGEDMNIVVSRVFELVYTAWDSKAFADDIWRDADERLRTVIQKQWEKNQAATGGHEWKPPEWTEIPKDGIPLPPFKWAEKRRAILRAELDAYYAKLYGLTRDELRYILDPKDIYGPDFPGETFRVLKEKEEKEFGEYRTRRLVLEAWDKLEKIR